jgi:hypothetical protein
MEMDGVLRLRLILCALVFVVFRAMNTTFASVRVIALALIFERERFSTRVKYPIYLRRKTLNNSFSHEALDKFQTPAQQIVRHNDYRRKFAGHSPAILSYLGVTQSCYGLNGRDLWLFETDFPCVSILDKNYAESSDVDGATYLSRQEICCLSREAKVLFPSSPEYIDMFLLVVAS